jgi:hypothetical protein
LWAEQAARVVQAVGVAVARFNRPVLVGGASGRKKGSGRVREKRDNKKVNEKLAVQWAPCRKSLHPRNFFPYLFRKTYFTVYRKTLLYFACNV